MTSNETVTVETVETVETAAVANNPAAAVAAGETVGAAILSDKADVRAFRRQNAACVAYRLPPLTPDALKPVLRKQIRKDVAAEQVECFESVDKVTGRFTRDGFAFDPFDVENAATRVNGQPGLTVRAVFECVGKPVIETGETRKGESLTAEQIGALYGRRFTGRATRSGKVLRFVGQSDGFVLTAAVRGTFVVSSTVARRERRHGR